MKNIKIYIISVCIILGTASCADFLREENLSDINSDEYFATVDGYEALVNGGYASLRTVWQYEPWLFCLGVDIYTRGESEGNGGSYENRDIYSSELNEYVALDSENGFVEDFYTNVYYGVQVCNTAINRASSVSGLSETTKNQRIAEMRALRAYYYYLLVEQFGEISIVTDEIESPVFEFPKSTEQEVYEFIISEIDAVKETLPTSYESGGWGRITQGMALHLESLVYLTRGYKDFGQQSDFTTAASLADQVINCGQYALLPTFEDVFTPGNEHNDEIIFSVQYDSSSLGSTYGGNGQSCLFGFEYWNTVLSGFERGNTTYGWKKTQFTTTQFLFSLYDTSIDSRYDVTFLSEFYATQADPSIGLEVGDLRLYFPKYDIDQIEDSIRVQNEWPNAIIITKDYWKPDIENLGGSGMCPMVWKFYDPNAAFPSNTTNYTGTRDIFLFRLADTYLMAAEAYYKAGDSSTAADRINSVRQRAALSGHTADMTISAADVDIDFILDERARELVGEYKRWPDLKRTGKLIERTLLHNELAARRNSMDDHILVRPFPQSVIDQSKGGFTQNPGY